VTMRIVNVFEMINIQHQGGDWLSYFRESCADTGKMRLEITPVIHAGETIRNSSINTKCIVVAQPFFISPSTDLGPRPRYQLVAFNRTNEIIIYTEFQRFRETVILAIRHHNQDWSALGFRPRA